MTPQPIHDADVRTAVVDELARTVGVNVAEVTIAVNHGVVTLSGEVDSHPAKQLVHQVVARVDGVRAVADQITVPWQVAPASEYPQ